MYIGIKQNLCTNCERGNNISRSTELTNPTLKIWNDLSNYATDKPIAYTVYDTDIKLITYSTETLSCLYRSANDSQDTQRDSCVYNPLALGTNFLECIIKSCSCHCTCACFTMGRAHVILYFCALVELSHPTKVLNGSTLSVPLSSLCACCTSCIRINLNLPSIPCPQPVCVIDPHCFINFWLLFTG